MSNGCSGCQRARTLFSSFVNDSVASINFLFLSWCRSSSWSSSASSFLCNKTRTHAKKKATVWLVSGKGHSDHSSRSAWPGAPLKTGPGVWGPACARWSRPSARRGPHSRWGSRWSADGCAGSEPRLNAWWKSRRRNLKTQERTDWLKLGGRITDWTEWIP